MYCQKCGTQLVEDARFCKECGCPVMEENTPEEQTERLYEMEGQGEQITAPKSRVLAGILGIVLGSYGVHNFYLGRVERGMAQLLLTLFAGEFTLTLFPIDYFLPFLAGHINNEITIGVLVCIWGMIEGVSILIKRTNTDAKGVVLKD